jgi:surface protein
MSTFNLVYNFAVGAAPTFPFTLTLPIVGGTVTSIDWGDGTTTGAGVIQNDYAATGTYTVQINWTGASAGSFNYFSGTGREYLTAVTSFGNTGLINASFMFNNATNLASVPATLPSSFTSTYYMFGGNTVFNGNISGWDTSYLTNIGGMFAQCSNFNQDISGWDTSSVTSMAEMFINTPFNQNLGGWDISQVTDMTDMLIGSGLSTTNYDATLTGWAAQTVQPNVSLGATGLTYSAQAARDVLTGAPNNWIITGDTYVPPEPPVPPVPPPAPRICFKEGTKILCKINNSEVYVPIEDIQKDTLVKTYKHGFKKCKLNVREKMVNTVAHSVNNLYCLSKNNNSNLIEDLYITGSHSMLYSMLSIRNKQAMYHLIKTYNTTFDIKINTKIDDKYKLIAYYDKSFKEVRKEMTTFIHHLVLENENKNLNYGIYANGVLTESIDELSLTKYLIKNNVEIEDEDKDDITFDSKPKQAAKM